MAIRFFHTPKNKKFKISPRYYNEQKEDLENRIQKIKREMDAKNLNDTDKSYTPNIKGQMHRNFKKNDEQRRKSSIRLVLILAVLSAIVYFLLYF